MKFENVYFPDSVGFRCVKCGFCCKNNPPDLTLEEYQKIVSMGFKNFLEPSHRSGDRRIRRKEDRTCYFLTKENTCQIHEIKPSICRLDPFNISKYDYKTNTIYLNLDPYSASTCKGIFTGEMIALEEIGKAAQETIENISKIMAEKTSLPITNKKVALLTSKLITYLNSN
jgi:Fe-S-cluster containining protein